MKHTDQRNPEVREPTTAREAFFEVAHRLNLTTIFGNPGTTEEPLLKSKGYVCQARKQQS